MASLRIPKNHQSALAALRDLPDDDFNRFVDVLRGSSTYLALPDLAARTAEAMPDDVDVDHGQVVQALLALRNQLKFHGWTHERLAREVSRADGVEPDDTDLRRSFQERIETLLDVESLATTANAADVQTQYERPFHSARVLTDIRPVFSEDPTEPPTGAVLTNVLKIEYFGKTGLESVWLALDHADVKFLRDALERALDKTATLKSFLGATGLSYFELEKEADNTE